MLGGEERAAWNPQQDPTVSWTDSYMALYTYSLL